MMFELLEFIGGFIVIVIINVELCGWFVWYCEESVRLLEFVVEVFFCYF